MEVLVKLRQTIRLLKQKLLELNFFQSYSNNPAVIHREILSTRIFIILLITSLCIITIFTSVRPQIRTVTIDQPDLQIYNYLYKRYGETLECPCSDISIPHRIFVDVDVSVHRICTSDLVSTSWLNLTFNHDLNRYWPIDIRYTMNSMWQLVTSFCRAAQVEIARFTNEFGNTALVSPSLFDSNYLNTQISSTIADTQKLAVQRFVNDLDIISTITHVNGFMSALGTNFVGILINGFFSGNGILCSEVSYLTPSTKKVCYSHRDGSCPIAAGVYLKEAIDFLAAYDLNGTVPSFAIPGLVFDTLPLSIVYLSSLECFFNESCIELLLSLYPTTSEINLPNAWESSRFPPNAQLKSIISELFIENIVKNVSFGSYFDKCRPISCTYTFVHRFDRIYVSTTIISLIGGLNMILRILSPFVVRAAIFFKRILRRYNRIFTIEEEQTPGHRLYIKNVVYNLSRAIMNFNIFNSRKPTNLRQRRRNLIATRVYVICMTGSIITLIIYTTQVNPRFSETINLPNIVQYELIHEKYSDSVQCPCTTVIVPNGRFIEIIPVFHQICYSDFIRPEWYRSLDYLLLRTNAEDFLVLASSFFQALSFFCNLANQTFSSAHNRFWSSYFVNTRLLSRSLFNIRVGEMLDSFEKTMRNEFIHAIDVTKEVFQSDSYVSGLGTNVRHVLDRNGDESINSVRNVYLTPETYNNDSEYICDCRRNAECFTSNHISTSQTIPDGIQLRCMMMNSVLSSNLACCYDATCTDALRNFFEVFNAEVPDILRPLDSDVPSKFFINSSIQLILQNVMMERLNTSIDYEKYFNQCKPNVCTYTYYEKSNVIYIITTIIGLIGGLSVSLRILCPIIVLFIFTAIYFRLRRLRAINRVFHRRNQFLSWFLKFNIFDDGSNDIMLIRQSFWSTRLYMVFFSISIIIIIVYTAIPTEQIEFRTENPTLDQYEYLFNKYNSTLRCYCQQMSIPYQYFSTVMIEYHPVCSSDFVNDLWIQDLMNEYLTTEDARTNIRITVGPMFRLLSALCKSAKSITDLYINQFMSNTFFTAQIISKNQFASRLTDVNEHYLSIVKNRLSNIVQIMRDFVHGNLLISSYGLNRHLWTKVSDLSATILNSPVILNDGCSCALRTDCVDAEPFISILPGFVLGCSIVESLLRSTLTSLYDEAFIENFMNYMIGSDPDVYAFHVQPKPLNAKNNSIFSPNATVQMILDDHFIETWDMNAKYDLFFYQCSPLYCVHMIDEQKSFAYIISKILGLYGGLTISLRIAIPLLVRILFFLKSRVLRNTR